jgi:glycerate 2-kinase
LTTGPARAGRLQLRRAAAGVLREALRAADPRVLVRRHLRVGPQGIEVGGTRLATAGGRVVVVAAGKAAAVMAAEAEAILGRRLAEAVAVDTSAGAPLRRTRLHVAGHPVPDLRGLRAAAEVERVASGLGADDTLILLLSGGASALLPAPADGIALADKARTTRLLLRAGAPIAEVNAVRKHLSRLKGGGLARAAAPARVVTLALSDVVGDDPATIASGPTVADPTTFSEAVEILRRRGLWAGAPAAVRRRLEAGAAGHLPETPKPGDPLLSRSRLRIIGSNRQSVDAAARAARRLGFRTLVLTTRLEGEAREAGRLLTAILRECVASGRPARTPVCLVAGGETTVSVTGQGRGGRNQELALAAVAPLAAFPGPALLASLATDGVDGASDAAGAIADEATHARARRLGLAEPPTFLAENDSNGFFAALGDLILTGPTGTNVADVTVLFASRAL